MDTEGDIWTTSYRSSPAADGFRLEPGLTRALPTLPLGPALKKHVTAPVEGSVDLLDSKLIRIREGLLSKQPKLFPHESLDVLARGRIEVLVGHHETLPPPSVVPDRRNIDEVRTAYMTLTPSTELRIACLMEQRPFSVRLSNSHQRTRYASRRSSSMGCNPTGERRREVKRELRRFDLPGRQAGPITEVWAGSTLAQYAG
jgi:hypothetical protein